MATRIPQRELRNNNAEVLKRVAAGESFVVTRNGEPVADVVPHDATSGPPRFPETHTLLSEPDPRLDRDEWLADIRGSDTFLDDDPLNSRA